MLGKGIILKNIRGDRMGKKATFILDEKIMEQSKEYVTKKRFKSMNAFVEKALQDEIAKIKKEEIKAALLEASQDPLFLADLKEIEEDFACADFEKVIK
jgi:hypothetical protein